MPRIRLTALLLVLALPVLSMVTTASGVAAATRTTYVARATFEADLGTLITDDYSPASGYPPGFGVYNNATMSGFFGETDYESTGFNNLNIVTGERYCAGCNGSFRLYFDTTSVTSGGVGVYGVGLDITANSGSPLYTAYVTYGDATTENIALPSGASFFGITSPDLITSIHFGLPNGGGRTDGSFQIDNLTIGSSPGGGPGVVTLYGVTGDGAEISESLFTLSLVDASPTFQASLGNGDDGETLAYNPDDDLLYHASGHTGDCPPGGPFDDCVVFESVDPDSFAITNVDIAGTALTEEEPLALTYWNSQGELLWLQNHFTDQNMYRVTPGGSPTFVGTLDHVGKGITFSLDETTLYTVSRDDAQLRTIDPSNGNTLSSTTIVLPGVQISGANGLATHPVSGELYALLKAGGGGGGEGMALGSDKPRSAGSEPDDLDQFVGRLLVTIDPDTGVASLIGDTGDSFAGIAFRFVEEQQSEADLSITKTASANPVVAGGSNLTYTVTATNNGPDDAQDVEITDNLPPGAAFVSATPSAGASCTLPPVGGVGGTVTCTWAGPTTVGQQRSITIVVRVCPEANCATVLTNTATVTGGGDGGGGGELVMWGSTSGGPGAPSDFYSIDPTTGSATFVGATGFEGVSGLEVLDDGRLVASANNQFDESLLIEIDRNSGSGNLIGVVGTFATGCIRVPDLAYDQTNDILYGYWDFCSAAPEGLTVIDQTTGDGTSVGPSGFGGGGNGLAWDPGSGTLYGTPFDQGSLVTFNTVTGQGTSVPGSIGNVPFRINALAFHPVTGDLYGAWNQGGANFLVTINTSNGVTTVIGPTVAGLDGIVFEQAGGGGIVDPNPDNNSATTVTNVINQSDLSVTKTDTPDPVIVGNTLTYNLTVTNAGPSNARSVVLTDNLPAGVTFQSAAASQGSCSHVAGVVTCNLGEVGAPNQCATAFPQQVTITIEVTVNEDVPSSVGGCPGQPLLNAASVGSTDNCFNDLNLANNQASASTDVLAGADVEIMTPLVQDLTPSFFFSAPEITGAGTVNPAGAAPSANPAAELETGASEALSPDADTLPASPALPLQDEECLSPGDVLRISQTFSNTGPNAFSAQRDNPGPEYEMSFPPEVVGQVGTCQVLQGGGTCSITANNVTWNGVIPVGETVMLQFDVRVRGGIPYGTEFCFTGVVHVDVCNTFSNTVTRQSDEVCVATTCEPTVDPNSALSGQVHLPILNFQGQNDVCRTWIEVQNVGDEFSKAALVTWGEPGFCPPQCAGPLKVECTGLLKPGSTWNFLGAQVPSGSKSGILFSFTARQLSDIGVDLGFDDIVSDVLCETLFFGVVGDCDDYRRFKKAYNEGLEFAGIPLDRAIGSPLAVEVLRHCPGDVTPGVEVSSKYSGIAGNRFGFYDPVFGGYAYYIPLIYAQVNDFSAILYLQNGGLECSSVEIWFKAQDDCLRSRICEVFTLAPGETYQFDPNDCVGPDFQGSAWVRASQPLGIAVDIIGKDVLMTYEGFPTELNFTFDPESAFATVANQVAYGPLIYSEFQGWDSGVQVQNFSSVLAAKVKVYFLDRSGGVVTTLVDWICPRGSQTFFLPVVAGLPGNWVGSIRVESQEWWSPGDPLVQPPNIGGVATLIKYTDAARSDTAEAIAYNLLTEQLAYDWQIGANAGGTESGVGLIAVPSLLKDLDGTGVTTELAIANLVPKPGFTDFGIYIYDQNGLLDLVCEKLNERQVEYINLDTWGYVSPGFKGSAIISAVFWEHDVFDDTGFFLRNLLGMAAVIVERTGTRLGEDVPGDEAAGTAGFPFRVTDEEDNEYFFDFEGPSIPVCPGIPITRPDPTACPDTFTASCDNCPVAIPDGGSATGVINVDIAEQCTIEDVNLLLDITHTFDGDLNVFLSHNGEPPAGSELFSGVCGGSDNIQALLDDEAGTPIGTVCPPSGFNPVRTESGFGLANFYGDSASGNWTILINDVFLADVGTLNNWELQFTLSD